MVNGVVSVNVPSLDLDPVNVWAVPAAIDRRHILDRLPFELDHEISARYTYPQG